MNYQHYMYVVNDVEDSTKNRVIHEDEAIILYVKEGQVEVVADRRFFKLEDDNLLVIQARNKITLTVKSGSYTIVRFRNYSLVKKVPQLRYEVNPHRFVHEFICYEGVTLPVIDALTQLKETKDVYDFQQLLAAIYKAFEQYEHNAEQHTFDDVVHYIKTYSHYPLTREDMAKRFGYNANYFSEYFKKEVGWGFNEFLTHVRLEKAKLLLRSSSLTIQEVAKEVGYQDGLYLSRKFSRQFGIAPSKFRVVQPTERVAALQFTGSLLAVGIEPVAVLSAYYNVPDVLTPYVKDATFLSPNWLREEIDWHGDKPSLILASIHEVPHKEYIARLHGVAPSIALDWDTHDRLEEVRLIGQLFQREQQAEDWIVNYQQKIEQAKLMLQESMDKNHTVGVYELRNHNRIGIWRSNARGGYNLFEMLKLRAPKRIEKEVLTPNRGIIIEEQYIAKYAADEMFVIVHSAEQEIRLYNEIWQGLPAMKRKKVHILRLQDFWSSEGVALEEQLKIQLAYLTGQRQSDIYL